MTINADPDRVRATARAEPVGSLLRTAELTAAFDRLYADGVCPCRSAVAINRTSDLGEVQALANEVVPSLVQHQLDAGLDVVTDGEMRRSIFLSSFYDAIDGLEGIGRPLEHKDDTGEVVHVGRSDPIVGSPLRKAASPLAEEVAFMRGLGEFPFKVTLPAPSYFYMVGHSVDILESAGYDTREQLVTEITQIEQRLIAEAVAAGARWIQLDFPLYPALVDADSAAALDSKLSASELLDRAIEADTKVIEHVPGDVVTGMHLCRGNMAIAFWDGSLEPVAERMFGELPYHRYSVEWEDTEREGDFSPLRFVPKDKIVALGVVSTKTPELESDDEVIAQLEEASTYLDMDQLAVTTQCGFSSVHNYHLIDAEEHQWRKLELVGRVADRVWGRS
ncbi:MAG TPA: cobalamin-independent methionine synthase II family protein [Baekduia sp.]|nr:cobalamin-independent methionine synthase II family protein [Baekduia sp.]